MGLEPAGALTRAESEEEGFSKLVAPWPDLRFPWVSVVAIVWFTVSDDWLTVYWFRGLACP